MPNCFQLDNNVTSGEGGSASVKVYSQYGCSGRGETHPIGLPQNRSDIHTHIFFLT